MTLKIQPLSIACKFGSKFGSTLTSKRSSSLFLSLVLILGRFLESDCSKPFFKNFVIIEAISTAPCRLNHSSWQSPWPNAFLNIIFLVYCILSKFWNSTSAHFHLPANISGWGTLWGPEAPNISWPALQRSLEVSTDLQSVKRALTF